MVTFQQLTQLVLFASYCKYWCDPGRQFCRRHQRNRSSNRGRIQGHVAELYRWRQMSNYVQGRRVTRSVKVVWHGSSPGCDWETEQHWFLLLLWDIQLTAASLLTLCRQETSTDAWVALQFLAEKWSSSEEIGVVKRTLPAVSEIFQRRTGRLG